MTTIEERKKNHDEHMEEHEKQKMRAILFKRVGFSCEEIARVMNVSESTVRALVKDWEDYEKELMDEMRIRRELEENN